jgi:hypothetical protein
MNWAIRSTSEMLRALAMKLFVVLLTVASMLGLAASPLSATTTQSYDSLAFAYDVGVNDGLDAQAIPQSPGDRTARRSGPNLDAAGAFLRVDGSFVAPRGALPPADVAVIGKVDDLGAYTLRPGERTLLNQLPNQGSPRLNYLQNDRVLRTEMGRGVPIRDVSVDPVTGALRNNTGFLRAERNILTNHEWVFDPKSGYWYPPG